MFQFPAFAFYPYVFRIKYLYIDHYKSEDVRTKSYDLAIIVIKGGFPHSEIAGSKLIRSSPTLIAAYHFIPLLKKDKITQQLVYYISRTKARCFDPERPVS